MASAYNSRETHSMTLTASAAVTAIAGSLLIGTPVKATLTATGHTPKINTHWNYVVHVTKGGEPASGKITAQIVDPIGGVHAVHFGKSTKNITNWPFNGEFRDYIVWPSSARGIPLELRIAVHVGSSEKVVSYAVTPQR